MKRNSILVSGILAALSTPFLVADKGGPSGGTDTKETAAPPVYIDVTQLRPARTDLVPRKGLVRDAGTQPRVSLDTDVVSEYAQVLKDFRKANAEATVEGNTTIGLLPPLPAVAVFRSPTGRCILADGFHRDAAHGEAKEKDILADIYEPAIPENTEDPDAYVTRIAVLFSCGVNEAHGVRRTQKDKRRAVQTLVNDPEWAQWSNVQIARLARVSEFMVRDMRPANAPTTRKTVSKSGKVTTVSTGRIGKKGGAAPKKSKAAAGKKGKGGKTTVVDTTPKRDEETDKAINKIVSAVTKTIGDKKATELKQALMAGTLENCPAREIRIWAGTSAARIEQAYALVIESRWKPSRAYSFMDKVPDSKMTFGEGILLAISKGGVAVEKIEDGGKKWKITIEKA